MKPVSIMSVKTRLCWGLAALLSLGLLPFAAPAQPILLDNPDWRESDVPTPPAFDPGKLVTFEMGNSTKMVYGVDPGSITLSRTDGLVRYVMVITSPTGVRNIMYEGLRCATGEVKTYARFQSPAGWQPVSDPQWRSVFAGMASAPALRFARSGGCDGAALPGSVSDLVYRMKNMHVYRDQ